MTALAVRADLWLCLIMLLIPSGCGRESVVYDETTPAERSMLPETNAADETVPEAGGGENPPGEDDAFVRKIVYTADLRLAVDDLDAANARITELVGEYKGYVSNSNVVGESGSQRTASWTIRIPVERFDDFRSAMLELGDPDENSLSSQDVTDEFYDLRTRIEIAQKEEQRLLEHMQKSTKNLQEILTMEKEVSRVRGEIERMQGRMQVLTNLTALTTINVTLYEKAEYTPAEPPTLAARIGDVFGSSVGALADAGEAVLLCLVGLAPWLPLLLPVLWIARRVWRRGKILELKGQEF